ncbi:hypothetical protein LU631_13815 [Erwinia tracheiphila]|uniref:Uncharacterized protein n=1 Tax=Erwinia tracheiphila TaxID=65700 RepID=A0A0M2K538_9GAMM|nr:hypothetical protein [Erwinia tracheiphila]EOS93455.1 hypothetical protein ETR_19056 [Erwinia tracheiphila PSU-1]KKF34490.1 hypothetical protein SY86_01875 [Erwinia tracheiphila]UIA86160.1 hypothetical protein LU631_13815 [Erwinia tracheiphila]UIA98376.1 hypothetical protein LU633_12025 [Erwinia tracheiphila]
MPYSLQKSADWQQDGWDNAIIFPARNGAQMVDLVKEFIWQHQHWLAKKPARLYTRIRLPVTP